MLKQVDHFDNVTYICKLFSKSCNYEKLISYRDMTLDTTCARKMSWSTETYEAITLLSVQSMSSYPRLHFSSLANKQLISAHRMARLFPLTQCACGLSSSYSWRKQRRAAHGNLHSLKQEMSDFGRSVQNCISRREVCRGCFVMIGGEGGVGWRIGLVWAGSKSGAD